ncbi:GAF domain-containing protein [Geomonas nitrogeniifigens]|uniref:histidine kinase n=1 Tax=Geomonas diazotrophica TaxID=2843197 RepID=A0ABX8JQD6_9BACT|nr:ATP-binding protein [Geomonas nitrogeniifigens]QWV99281.1 GAF domain-containing protein [Geomonas nitrogeniifigens]QXE88448.1 GAF domain-containing protein [Geomonas nitrogeniifigens]
MPTSPDSPLYNSRIFDSYLKLLRKRYPNVDTHALLAHAGMKRHEVSDPGHWFTQRQVNRFHEKLVQATGEQGIAREAGRYSASPEVLGPLRSFFLGMIGPEYIFYFINKIAPRFTRSSRCTARKTGPREIELTVAFNEGVQENPRQCENRVGFFEAAFLLFDHDFPEIEHPECVFKGGEVCRYLIRWRPSLTNRLLLAQRVISLFLVAGLLADLFYNHTLLGPALFLGLLAYLSFTLLSRNVERKALLSSLTSMRGSSERLLSQVQENFDRALAINEIGQVIATRTELGEILSSVNQVLHKRLGYGRGIVVLLDPQRNTLVLQGCFGLTTEDEERVRSIEFPLAAASSPGVLVSCFRTQQPVLVGDIEEIRGQAEPENYALISALGVRSFICAPIVCEGEALGVLAVDDASREGGLLQSDLNLIQGIAPVIGISVRNAMRLANERRLSDQLRKASEHLERRVAERTSELSQAYAELEYLYDSVSHDLRTPLRVIYGYGELLLEGYGDKLDDPAKEYLASIIKGGERMEETLDRMLDFSEVKSALPALQPVDLSLMALRIMSELRITDPKREVSLEIEDGVVVTGDEKLLAGVMENLLGNAWKYSALKGCTRIAFGQNDGICYVRDNGEGFDMAQAGKLFLPFQKLHDGSRFRGHGLGLSMVRRMLERMGGKVWGEGRPGEGATFYFTLPPADTR